jgi:uncharacterized protein (TIGR03067 family)
MPKCLLALSICLFLAANAADDAVRKEVAALEGEWLMVSAERDGTPAPADIVRSAKRVSKGDETKVFVQGRLFARAKFTVDPSKSPKTIDYAVAEGQFQGMMQLGIYELNGDSVKYCFADPGKQRPTDFTTRGKSGYTVGIWKRDRK